MAKQSTKPPAKPSPKGPTAKNLPARVDDDGEGMGIIVQDQMPDHIRETLGSRRGTENVGVEDLVVPRLEIVQALSPAVKRGDPGFIEGARMGMLNNSVTRELYGDSVMLIPVHYHKQWLVWKDRKFKGGSEGGFFGAYSDPDQAQDRAEQEGGENEGIMVVDTPTHLCIVLGDDGPAELMISMPRTKAKVSRQWNSMIKLTGADSFARVYKISTQLQKNKLGDFYNFVVAPTGYPNKKLFAHAETLYNNITSGVKKVVMDTSHMDSGSETERSDM